MQHLKSGGYAVWSSIAETPDIFFCIANRIHKQNVQWHASRAVIAAIDERSRVCRNAGKVKRNFYGSQIASERTGTVPGSPHAGGCLKTPTPIAICTDSFIDNALFVETAGAAVHMIAYRTSVLPEKTSVQLACGIPFHNEKIKIIAVCCFLNGVRRNGK